MSRNENVNGHGESRHDGTGQAADQPGVLETTVSGQPFYRHFKGRYYQVVGEALDTATEGRVVVYRTLYPSGHALFTRPYDAFHGWKDSADGQRVRRFTPIAYADLPDDARAHVVAVLHLSSE
ncbi:DUF1653 domain-containing protein [Nitratidesulfovibrio liaohensis]|uniref:DUF1653 domain-containing protein n=1 Tax=Nitratidesulfovibrio liaohensis TaxID=2604158 RepID=A0ABY9R442_9BACT|nr:DUF1653 domain-containing protein [Nitratidesulfovibrio liaohensis]WMW65977.1 DUF1653 domain-containing protein [Nitratidesulfovibrio liaohensis]